MSYVGTSLLTIISLGCTTHQLVPLMTSSPCLHHFHASRFKISSLVIVIVDGASSNLSCIKLLLEVKEVFEHEDELTDQHSITISTTNPLTGYKLFFMMCPSPQVWYILLIGVGICYHKYTFTVKETDSSTLFLPVRH